MGDFDIRFQCGTPLKVAAYDVRLRGDKRGNLE
jgi:hypothetical protein